MMRSFFVFCLVKLDITSVHYFDSPVPFLSENHSTLQICLKEWEKREVHLINFLRYNMCVEVQDVCTFCTDQEIDKWVWLHPGSAASSTPLVSCRSSADGPAPVLGGGGGAATVTKEQPRQDVEHGNQGNCRHQDVVLNDEWQHTAFRPNILGNQ